jgi:excisionase family DNA binding protein
MNNHPQDHSPLIPADPFPIHPLTLSVPEAAKALGIGRGLAYELVRTGQIPCLRLGRRIVIPRHGLANLVSHGPGQAA